MSGITAQSSRGMLGSEAGKSWMHREIRGARPSPLDLLSRKRVPYLASIAFLLTLLVPFLVFSQVAARTLSGIVTSGSGSPIPNAHLYIRNTGVARRSPPLAKKMAPTGYLTWCRETTKLQPLLPVS
jgi:hypothetical protein